MALGQLFKRPLLIHGAAAGLPGPNRAEGQVVMNGPPSAGLGSLCPVQPGGPLGNAGGHAVYTHGGAAEKDGERF